jgi:hypothetical protein
MARERSCRLWISVSWLLAMPAAALSPSPCLSSIRRALLMGGGGLTAGAAGWSISTPPAAHAATARGAAELDLEYYLKDLVGGNKREGTVSASPAPPLPPPRQLQDPLASLLLNHDCTVDCLTSLALVEVVHMTQPRGRGPGVDPVQLEKDIKARVIEIRTKTQSAFYQQAPWQTESIFDQYYFDFTSYALWKTAATLLPESSYATRDEFVRRTGRFVLSNLQRYGKLIVSPSSTSSTTKSSKNQPPPPQTLVQSVAGIQEILDLFTKDNICNGFRLGDRPIARKGGGNQKGTVVDDDDDVPIFLDELDDEALAKGGSVDCLVSVYEPATLRACLQITAERSRFIPDFIGPTLAAYWESTVPGLRVTWETYFVDAEYRPNPKGRCIITWYYYSLLMDMFRGLALFSLLCGILSHENNLLGRLFPQRAAVPVHADERNLILPLHVFFWQC